MIKRILAIFRRRRRLRWTDLTPDQRRILLSIRRVK